MVLVYGKCECFVMQHCIFVSCMNPVAVRNAAFCMTCSLLMLVEDERCDHMEKAYSRTDLMTVLYVAMSVCTVSGCMYFFAAFVLVCVDVMVMP